MSESRHERPGVYSSYDASTVITTGRGSKTVGVAAKAVKEEARAQAGAASYRSKAERAQEAKKKQQIKLTEEKISAFEAEAAALTEEIARPEVAADYKLLSEKCARLDALHAELDKLYEEYEKLI